MSDPAGAPPTRIVLHADDVGMCHGANAAFVELARLGTISAGSVMVPCPWFPDLAAEAAADGALDVGVHLTLTSEHASYRWGPVSPASAASGLRDQHGYLWRTVSEVRANAHPDAVEAEWRAQIERASAAGLTITHLDAHMGAALAPEWCDRYVALGVELGVPALMSATLSSYGPRKHLAGVTDETFAPFVDAARAAGMPVFDAVLETDFSRPAGTAADYRRLLAAAPPGGLVYAALHPCQPGPGEIEWIEPNRSFVRTDEYELFRTDEWATWLATQPFDVIGMAGLGAPLAA